MRRTNDPDIVLKNENPYEILYPRKRAISSSCDESTALSKDTIQLQSKPEILLNGNTNDTQTRTIGKGGHNRMRSSTMPIPSRTITVSGHQISTRSKSHQQTADPRMRTLKKKRVLIGQKRRRITPRDYVSFVFFLPFIYYCTGCRQAMMAYWLNVCFPFATLRV